jgi:hypothetical protein
MSLTQYSNGSDQHVSQQDENSVTSPSSVLERVYSLVDLPMLAQENNEVDASGPHIVLTCGPYDDEDDNE